MTIPEIDMVVAIGMIAAIGPIDRFDGPDKLVAYFGLNPSVHQSGRTASAWSDLPSKDAPTRGPCSSKPLVKPSAVLGRFRVFPTNPWPARQPHRRKLAVIVWHLLSRGEDYAWVRPALHAKKLRDLEFRSGLPVRRGQRGAAYEYNLTAAANTKDDGSKRQSWRTDD
jgi:transposase